MGYSMGGYGALILPALNPDVFTVGVPLSMSFRTDEQYMAEPQDVFNSQWGVLFGGFGTTGPARLTDHFIQHSPFHFFGSGDLSRFDGLHLLLDCGDDEESLSITSDELHTYMRDNNIAHEYRVRNGGHSFEYWKKSYPEAFKFINDAMEGIPHPTEPEPASIGTLIDDEEIQTMEVAGLSINIMTPVDYIASSATFPVLYILHDYEEGHRQQNIVDVFSMLRNNMTTGVLTKAIVVEIPVDAGGVSNDFMLQLVNRIDSMYHTISNRQGRVILGNENGGTSAALTALGRPDVFGACFLFNASLPVEAVKPASEVFYYLDMTDGFISYRGNHQFYTDIRKNNIDYQYRVRQGGQNYQAFLNGLAISLSSIRETLTN